MYTMFIAALFSKAKNSLLSRYLPMSENLFHKAYSGKCIAALFIIAQVSTTQIPFNRMDPGTFTQWYTY